MMADVTVKKLDEIESYKDQGQFLYAGKSLGITAWGMNLLKLPPNWPDYPEHDHRSDAQEEAYVILEGDATLLADGERWPLAPGMLARVGAAQKRRIVPGPRGVTMLALGGTPGAAFKPRWAGTTK
jgi:uncharacterized cupin superfamily protein